jgi:hypothetical protein
MGSAGGRGAPERPGQAEFPPSFSLLYLPWAGLVKTSADGPTGACTQRAPRRPPGRSGATGGALEAAGAPFRLVPSFKVFANFS